MEGPAMNVGSTWELNRFARNSGCSSAAYMLFVPPIRENTGSNGGAMTLEKGVVCSVVVLHVRGRLVLGDGDQLLKERVASHFEKGNRHVLLNMSKVSYVDSSGLGVIVASFLAARSVGGALRLVNPSSRLHQLLTMAKLLTVVDVRESDEEAVESFGVLT